MNLVSRQDFLKRGSLLAVGTAGIALLPNCASSTHNGLVIPSVDKNLFRLSFKTAQRVNNKQSVHGLSVVENNDGSGDFSYDPNTDTFQGSYTASDGTGSFTGALYQSSTNQLVQVSAQSGSTQGSNTATFPSADPILGQPQTITYNDGSALHWVTNDGQNATGTLTDSAGNAWALSLQMTDTQVTLSYNGPESGTISATLNPDGTVTPSSIHPMSARCDAIGKLGITFGVASAFLTLTGIGVFMGMAYLGVSLGLGIYREFLCK